MAKIRMDTMYILTSHKVTQGTPERAREYIDAFRDVLYEQLAQNGEFYWHGMGNFEKAVSSKSGQYLEVQNFGTGRRETMWIEPKYVVGFKVMDKIEKALNDGEEEYPKRKSKRKYKAKEYQEIRNERRRKEVLTPQKEIDNLMANARYARVKKEREDGEENGSI